MEKKAMEEAEDESASASASLTIGIAINEHIRSSYLVKWALERFVPEANVVFKLLHVRPKMIVVPTPMGNYLPISQVRDDVAATYRKELEWKANEMLLPYKNMCAKRKVEADVVVVESDEVANAIAEEVSRNAITRLVIGTSTCGMFTRMLKNNLSSRISACTPSFCTVYAISKGKLSSIRPSDSEINISSKDESSETSSSSKSSSGHSAGSHTEFDSVSTISTSRSSSLPMERYQAPSTTNRAPPHTKTSILASHRYRFYESMHSRYPDNNHSRCQSLDAAAGNDDTSSCPRFSGSSEAVSRNSSCKSLPINQQSLLSDQIRTSDAQIDHPSESEVDVKFELEYLRTELRHVREMYAVAQSETIDASHKLNTLSERRLEEAAQLKEMSLKEEKARDLARQEKEKCEAAIREVEDTKGNVDREASLRREAETKASNEAKEKEKLENFLIGPIQRYQKFTWEEIVSATSSFSDDLRVGMGAYGTVYKCQFHYTTAAAKVLHSKESSRTKQFQQELEILSKIRHPNLLLLLGACPEQGCLVYEYMENGNLEERLLRKNNTPPIPWFERFRIAWEIASALLFLHNSKPRPIIHRDLKPANILLDRNFVSKISDVGLSMMIPADSSYTSTMYKDTGPVGTLCYLDPEYQRTGLVSPKCDVYAFGLIILQLLTAKQAIALTSAVETAIDNDNLVGILDSDAGNWPVDETKELAILGLSCAEMRRKDRPDLKDGVLPVLERMKEVANKARTSISNVHIAPPNHFICPVSKDVMDEPCVAADGYTYDRKAIEKWIETNDTSPTTNLALSNKNLLPNYSLLSAIVEWKSSKQ